MGEIAGRLSGNQTQVVDQKNRLVIPAKFRHAFASSVTVGPWPQDDFLVLAIWSPDNHAARMQELEQRARTDRAVENLVTIIDASTEALELDDQSRITLTPDLKGIAGLERDVVVIGRGDHLEVWTQGRWDDFRRKAFDSPQQLRDSLFKRS